MRIDASDTASVDRSIPINQRPPDATRATNADHNIVAFRRNSVDGKRLSQDQPIMNVFCGPHVSAHDAQGPAVWHRGAVSRQAGHRFAGPDTIPDPANPLRAIDDPNVCAYTAVYTPRTTAS